MNRVSQDGFALVRWWNLITFFREEQGRVLYFGGDGLTAVHGVETMVTEGQTRDAPLRDQRPQTSEA